MCHREAHSLVLSQLLGRDLTRKHIDDRVGDLMSGDTEGSISECDTAGDLVTSYGELRYSSEPPILSRNSASLASKAGDNSGIEPVRGQRSAVMSDGLRTYLVMVKVCTDKRGALRAMLTSFPVRR